MTSQLAYEAGDIDKCNRHFDEFPEATTRFVRNAVDIPFNGFDEYMAIRAMHVFGNAADDFNTSHDAILAANLGLWPER